MVFLRALMVDGIRIFKEAPAAFKIAVCHVLLFILDLLLSADRIVFVLRDNTQIIVPYTKMCLS